MSSKKKFDFKAKLTCTKRDTATSSPRVLLVEVMQEKNGKLVEFREHTFVSLCKRLAPLLPKTTGKTVHITFRAAIVKYKGSDGKTKKGLTELRDVKEVM